MMTQTERASPITPLLVISASNPFVAFSLVVKGRSLLVITPSSIPISAT